MLLVKKLGIEISTSSPIWTWAMRQAAWVINRFSVTAARGITSFELLNGKPYVLERYNKLVNWFLVFRRATQKATHVGDVWCFWARLTRRTHTCSTMELIWFWQGLSEGSTLAGKVIWRFTLTSAVAHMSTGAALVEEWCQQRAVVHPVLLASTLQLEMWNLPSSLMRTLRQSGRKLLKSNVKTMKQPTPTWPSTTNRTLCRRWINSLRFDWKMQV